jgi:hypothetical protein
MRVGRFLKQLISPEIDRINDRLETLVSEAETPSPPVKEIDDGLPARPFTIEKEPPQAVVDPVTPLADEVAEAAVRSEPGPDLEPEPDLQPQPEELPESVVEEQIVSGQ